MVINSEDWGKVALFSLLPGATLVSGAASQIIDKNCLKWFKALKKPAYVTDNVYLTTAVDIATLSPLGCAAFLVYKHGGGFENSETLTALSVFGVTLAASAAAFPVMVKQKNLKFTFFDTAGVAAGTSIFAGLFYKIHPTAGLMSLPLVLWTLYWSVAFYQMWQLNGEKPSISFEKLK